VLPISNEPGPILTILIPTEFTNSSGPANATEQAITAKKQTNIITNTVPLHMTDSLLRQEFHQFKPAKASKQTLSS
jgi:hypothetical protein